MGLPSWVTDPIAAQSGRNRGLRARYPGSGPDGAWTANECAVYDALLSLVGPDLLGQVGRRGGPGIAFYSLLGRALALGRGEPGPDGTRVVYRRNFPRGTLPPNTGGWTWGNTIVLLPEDRGNRPRLLHEYVHVLQYRREAVQAELVYGEHAWLPPLWEVGSDKR